MFGFLFDLATVAVGAILPIFRTWKVLKSRRSTQLVSLAKYWTVFASWVSLETVANIFYLPYLIPCYPMLKFALVLYTSLFGYEHIYQKLLCPMLRKYEPDQKRLLASFYYYAPVVTRQVLSLVWNALPLPPRMAQLGPEMGAHLLDQIRPLPAVQITELEEQELEDELDELIAADDEQRQQLQIVQQVVARRVSIHNDELELRRSVEPAGDEQQHQRRPRVSEHFDQRQPTFVPAGSPMMSANRLPLTRARSRAMTNGNAAAGPSTSAAADGGKQTKAKKDKSVPRKRNNRSAGRKTAKKEPTDIEVLE